MVRHEAVRNYGELMFSCGARNLREEQIHDRRVNQQALPLERAECQGIPVESEIVEGLEMFGPSGAHAIGCASSGPSVRLKPDATGVRC